MKIAVFDIDDTIVEETKFMKENAANFIKKKYGIDIKEINSDGYDVKEVYDLPSYFIKQGYTIEESIKKSDEITKEFWNKNFVKYCMQSIKPGVKETIDYFIEQGYQVHFISLRGKKTNTNGNSFLADFIRLNVVPFLTKMQLAKSGVKYDTLKLVKTNEEKIDYINSMSPDFVFEDQPSIIEKVNPNSKVFCILNSHNKSINEKENIVKLENFKKEEIEKAISERNEKTKTTRKNYLIGDNVITDMKISNPTYLRKILTEATYTIVKKVGTPVFISKCKPIIKGSSNIPEKGAVAFVGNHRDKLDPVIVTISADRKVHWGALLRMFQGKENLFSSGKNPIPCYMSAAFITAMGAVPIARKTDEDYFNINLKSIEMLYQILAWDGAVGLFPEGTLNREPEKQNILPLKSNRIFRLVKDNEGIIQPFSVVWLPKDLSVENRVIINYGTPINTRNKNINEISSMWDESVNSGIESSKKLINDMKCVVENYDNNAEKQQKIKTLVKQFKNI